MHPYESIRAEFLRRINDQTWPAGFTLPQEEKLAEEFGVARGTIRRALGSLVEAGLIERRRRAGTRVVDRRAHSSTLTIPIVRHQIESRDWTYSYKLIQAVNCPTPPSHWDIFDGAPLKRVTCLHLGDGQPFQLEDRVINLEAIPEAVEEGFEMLSPNEWLIQRAPYSSIQTTLKAELAQPLDQRHLGIEDTAPVFVIERQTRFKQAPLTAVRLSHAADRFEISTQTGDLS